MKTALRFVIVLGLICLVMGGGVALLYATFRGDIARKETEQFQVALRRVLPEGKVEQLAGQDTETTEDDVFCCVGPDGKPLGYAARGGAQGYSSVVQVLVGTEGDGRTVSRVAVLSQQETPGLGANVEQTKSTYNLWQKIGVQPAPEPETTYNAFLDRFAGHRADELDKVDAMVAATITSNAVKGGVRQAVDRIQAAISSAGE